MKRPSRLELLNKFFPTTKEVSTSADKEAANKFNARACEAILCDMVNMFDKGHHEYGPGVLCLRIHKGSKDSEYLSLEDLSYDLEVAQSHGDTEIANSINDVLSAVKDINAEKCALLMLVDNSRMQVLPVDRKKPGKSIESMLKELAA